MFHATEIAMQLIAAVRPIAEAVLSRDKNLASQMRDAASGAALNTAEGGRRVRGDRNAAAAAPWAAPNPKPQLLGTDDRHG